MKICITGAIGSGKSSVIEILKKLSYKCVSSDEINNDMLKDPSYIEILIDSFGKDIIYDGNLDKNKLAQIIFNDDEKRKLLNSISHPLITKRILEIIKKNKDIIFVEIPLLIESGMATIFDKIWLVESDFDIRLKRIVYRDNLSADMAIAKIKSQVANEYKLKKVATDTIYNNSNDLGNLELQVIELLKGING